VEVTGWSPVFGRPSPASSSPWKLGERTAATASVRADGADTGWCVLRAASMVGVRHRLAGRPVEDAWAWGGAEEHVVLAVADGVGSLPASGPVATAAVAAAVAAASAVAAAVAPASAVVAASATCSVGGGDAAPGDPPAPWPDLALQAAVVAANAAVSGVEDGATTLVVALVGRDGSADVIRVGDSTAFVLSDGTWSELFVDADGADMRSPATAALPSVAPRSESARVELGPGDALMLVTDGVGDPLRDGPGTVGPGLADGLAEAPHPLALAGLIDFSRQGCHDDRTLAAIWLR
jgi:serine/threonine protein phosphatase PrpC